MNFEDKIKNFIKSCENNEFCLTGYLYYINKYLWTQNPEEKKSKTELIFMYKSFLEFFLQTNFQISNYESYLSDINNTISIIWFIFNKINMELTFLNKMDNPIIPYFNSNDMQLKSFMNNFRANNNSIISEYFTGFSITKFCCNNCMMRDEYTPINYLIFDLSKGQINQCQSFGPNINNFNNNMLGNSYNQLNNSCTNIYTCINQEFNQTNFFSCVYGCNAQKSIQLYSLPKILTIILKNNEGNFFINDKIDLTGYSFIKEYNNYFLIAMLCKLNYNNTYITYCFNYKDCNWYCFGPNQTNSCRVTYLDTNAIPFVLVYQKIDQNINFNYNPINLNMANNKIGYNFKFKNGSQATLFFEIHETVEGAKKIIESHYNLKNTNFLVNALVRQNNEKLCEIDFKTIDRIILVI